MTNHNIIVVTATIALLIAASSSSANAVKCNKADRAALLAFKDSFPNNKHDAFYYSYPEWDANSTVDCCKWNYIKCDKTGRVTSFVLSAYSDFFPPMKNISGMIPAVLGELTALKNIQFGSLRGLVGPIPPEIAKLKNLQTLDISNCKISGAIPPSLAELVNLRSLILNDNQLTGIIPPHLFSKLPKSSAAFLDLSTNKLEGSIPKSFADVNFDNCYLDDNKLEGDLSPLFGRNKTISFIAMFYNNFRFDLTNIEYPLALKYLDISNNEIYGSISNQITEVPGLYFVDFSYNNLCGKIPSGGHFPNFTAEHFDAVYFEHNKCLCGAPLKPLLGKPPHPRLTRYHPPASLWPALSCHPLFPLFLTNPVLKALFGSYLKNGHRITRRYLLLWTGSRNLSSCNSLGYCPELPVPLIRRDLG